MKLETRFREWRRSLLLRDFAEGAAWSFAFLAGALSGLALLDRLFLLPYPVRLAGFLLLAALAGYCLWRYFLGPALYWTPQRVFSAADRLQPGLSRVLLPAWEFRGGVPPHVSSELALQHRARAESLAESLPPLRFGSKPGAAALKAAAGAALAAALLLGWSDQPARFERLLAPWRRVALESLLELTGDRRLPWGSPVSVSARWKNGSREPLALFVRSPGGPWREQPWDDKESGQRSAVGDQQGFSWSIASLTEELRYQVRWRDQSTPANTLVPVPYPQFSEVHYRLTPPPHAGLPAEELPGGGDIEALAGTRVEIVGRTADPVERSSLFALGKESAFARGPGGEFRAAFTALQSGAFRWELAGAGGITDPQPAEHKLTVLEDRPPVVEILSPTFEIEIGPKEELPVAFSATDDFGLTGVQLVFRARLGAIDSGEETRAVPGLAPRSKEWVGEYRWPLAAFIPGSRVEFFLLAKDNAKPPHVAKSAAGVLHIVDFDAAHKDAMTERAAVEESLKGLEARGRDLAAQMRRSPREPALDTEAREKDAALSRDWAKELEAQDRALEALERDPYLNPAVPPADRAVLEDLKRAARSLLPEARQAAASGDWKKAAEAHEALAQEAARAGEHMKEIGAFQDVRDMTDHSQKLDRAAAGMEQALKDLQAKGAKDEDWKELEKQMKELQREMAEFAKSLQKFAQKAPQRMTGQEKVYQLPVLDALQQQEALQAALARRDLAAAARAARELSRRLAEMRKTLEEASGGMAPPEPSRASKKVEELMTEWDQAVREQETALTGVRGLEEERTRGLLTAQKALLAELARLQRAALERERGLRLPLPAEVRAGMVTALGEFEAARVEKAPAALLDAVGRLRLLSPSRPEDSPVLDKMRQDEEEILARLGKGAQAPPPPQERKDRLRQSSQEEAAVRERVAGLEKKASGLRREAVFLPRQAAESLSGAQAEAGAAAQALEQEDSKSGLEHEQKALELLQQGRDQAAQSLEQEQRMEAVLSLPAPGGARGVRRAGGAGGQAGAATGPVKLPSASDYQPPQEIRRQVLESLQEKMPPAKAPEIKQYLKKVAE